MYNNHLFVAWTHCNFISIYKYLTHLDTHLNLLDIFAKVDSIIVQKYIGFHINQIVKYDSGIIDKIEIKYCFEYYWVYWILCLIKNYESELAIIIYSWHLVMKVHRAAFTWLGFDCQYIFQKLKPLRNFRFSDRASNIVSISLIKSFRIIINTDD